MFINRYNFVYDQLVQDEDGSYVSFEDHMIIQAKMQEALKEAMGKVEVLLRKVREYESDFSLDFTKEELQQAHDILMSLDHSYGLNGVASITAQQLARIINQSKS